MLQDFPVHGGRLRSVFTAQQLTALKDYVVQMQSRGFGLTILQCRSLIFEYAEANQIKHSFDMVSNMAGVDWLTSFREIHGITLRAPEATSISRAMGFNRVEVAKFYTLLEEVRSSQAFAASNIYNVDESGLSTVPTKLLKVLSPCGAKRVAKVVSAERGRTITLVCGISAGGAYVPPFLIFPRVRMRPELLCGCPPGTKGVAQKTGWMTGECFLEYLEHFVLHVKCSQANQVLLLVDNHCSHITLAGINYCRENGIIMIGFPPHIFGPLKTY